jgi:hypothetical protein
MIIGGIMGAAAGISKYSYGVGYSAGHTASAAFYRKYGFVIFGVAILSTALLTTYGVLPGTGKFKRRKDTQPAELGLGPKRDPQAQSTRSADETENELQTRKCPSLGKIVLGQYCFFEAAGSPTTTNQMKRSAPCLI